MPRLAHREPRRSRASDLIDEAKGRLEDEAKFLKSWLEKPLVTASVAPSSRQLARAMAACVDPRVPGPVIELGPGTGPVTEALLRRGVDESRLVLLEFNPDFCELLRGRFPRARIVQGDAYDLARVARGAIDAPAAAIVSGLPLFTKPEERRLALLDDAFDVMHAGCPFVQFTYALVSPMPLKAAAFRAERSPRIWLNLPPAQVWTYRRG